MIERKRYRFGEVEFVPHRQMLRHKNVYLTPGSRSLDLLELLVSKSGEVVSKDELIAFAWPESPMKSTNLKVAISALRKVLPALPSGLPYIATVQGRGYRFVARVEISADDTGIDADPKEYPPGAMPMIVDLVGRDQQVSELTAMLADERFVTVVGPAGVGKTTLAVAVALELKASFRDGVRFADLAVIDEAQQVVPVVAAALGSVTNTTNVLAEAIEAIRHKHTLLVLDNCEHVLSSASLIADHLRSVVPSLVILATSREPLRARHESVYRLPALEFPSEADQVDSVSALDYSAVRLFVRRAFEANGYRFEDVDASAVAAICRRLDGIALAIELAVAHFDGSNAQSLLRLLDVDLEPLNVTREGRVRRHQTLLATLEWSYRILSRSEARLFRELSVFTGHFSLEDIVGIASDDGGAIETVTSLAQSLVSKSMVSQIYQGGELRYRLLDIMRGFAGGALKNEGEQYAVLMRFSRYLLRVFEAAEAEWQWRARRDWTASYGKRVNDLRKAIEWLFGDGGDPELGVRLTAAAIPLWDELSTVGESRSRVERALQFEEAELPHDLRLRMKLLASYGNGLNFSDHLGAEVDDAWRECYRLAVEIDDAEFQLRALWGHAVLQTFSGRHLQALATLEQFEDTAELRGEISALPDGKRFKHITQFYTGDITGAQKGLEVLVGNFGDDAAPTRMSRFQIDRLVGLRVALAFPMWIRGDHAGALRITQQALDRASALEHMVSEANALAQAAIPLTMRSGDIERARRLILTLKRGVELRDLAIWDPVCQFYQAAVGCLDDDEASLDIMHREARRIVRNGFLVRVPMYLTVIAEAALKFGRPELAIKSLAEASEHAERQSEHWYDAEILRVKGLLLWREEKIVDAEAMLRAAIACARRQGALTFELSSTTALARMLGHVGRGAEGLTLLEPVYRRVDAHAPSTDVRLAGRVLRSLATERE